MAEKNRLAEPQQPKLARDQAKRLLRLIEQQVEDLDRAAAELIDGDDQWKRKSQIITSVLGVSAGHRQRAAGRPARDRRAVPAGHRQARRPGGRWPTTPGPGAGSASSKAEAARPQRPLHGRLNAIKYCERFKRFAKRLRDAGKPFKVIVTAAMRKLLVTLNQMVKTDTTYPTNFVVSVP